MTSGGTGGVVVGDDAGNMNGGGETGGGAVGASLTDARPGLARESARGGEEPRRRRGGARQPGFNDGIERAFCVAGEHVPPPGFPVQHRTGVATLRRTVVDRRDGSLLLCDAEHGGPHRWPDGEAVGGEPDRDR